MDGISTQSASIDATVNERLEQQDDLEIAAAARAGDETAFEEIVRRYAARVHALVAGMIRDRVAVEDVVQDVFFKVYRKLPTFEGKSRLYTWIYRVAFNTASDWRKRKRIERAVDTEDFSLHESTDPESRPERPLDRGELRRRLAEAVAELPPRYRDILVLREYEELSYEEIAEVLQCSKGTVESRLFRARARLREKMQAWLD